MTTTARFDAAVRESRSLPSRPDSATLLKLYALYKQASEGDAKGQRPDMTDFVARAKWDAWHALGGCKSDAAIEQYIALIEELKGA
jgi:acyl-CoA-binding protein